MELRRLYPDEAKWREAVAPVLMPLIASSIGEAMVLLEPDSSGQELSSSFRKVFSSEQVIKDFEKWIADGAKN